MDDALIRPIRGKHSPELPPVAVMAATRSDAADVMAGFPPDGFHQRKLFEADLFVPLAGTGLPAVAGPFVGAPYAAMVLENLIAWGASRILFVGICGAVTPAVSIGDVIVPDGAFVDEGTSLHYGAESGDRVPAGTEMAELIRDHLETEQIPFHTGPIWTIDAVFRETPEKIARFRGQGALAVEMEMSALFTVARFRGVGIGAVLVVSDDVSGVKWVRGFAGEPVTNARSAVNQSMSRLCSRIAT